MFTHYCLSYRLPRKHIITSFAYFCHSLPIICINHVKLLTCNHERHCHCTVSLFSASIHTLRMQQIIMSLSFTYSFHFRISLLLILYHFTFIFHCNHIITSYSYNHIHYHVTLSYALFVYYYCCNCKL